ncbi:MAG: AI-2E family transporter [Mycoplasma sp.]
MDTQEKQPITPKKKIPMWEHPFEKWGNKAKWTFSIFLFALVFFFFLESERSKVAGVFLGFLPLFLAIGIGSVINPIILFFQRITNWYSLFWKVIFTSIAVLILLSMIAAILYFLIIELSGLVSSFLGDQASRDSFLNAINALNSNVKIDHIDKNGIWFFDPTTNKMIEVTLNNLGSLFVGILHFFSWFKSSFDVITIHNVLQDVSNTFSTTKIISLVFSNINIIFTIFIVLVYTIFISFYVSGKYKTLTSWMASNLPFDNKETSVKVANAFKNSVFTWARAVSVNTLLLFILVLIGTVIAAYGFNSQFFKNGIVFFPLFFAIFAIIPYIGTIIGYTPILIAGLTDISTNNNFWPLIIITLFIAIGLLLQGFVIGPIIFSKFTRLHPVTVLVGIGVFAGLFGFGGTFFAVPILTTVKSVANNVFNKNWRI